MQNTCGGSFCIIHMVIVYYFSYNNLVESSQPVMFLKFGQFPQKTSTWKRYFNTAAISLACGVYGEICKSLWMNINKELLMSTININCACDRYIPNAFVEFLCTLARRINDSQLICTEIHLVCFYMIWNKTKMKLNWQHYEELPNVPINL